MPEQNTHMQLEQVITIRDKRRFRLYGFLLILVLGGIIGAVIYSLNQRSLGQESQAQEDSIEKPNAISIEYIPANIRTMPSRSWDINFPQNVGEFIKEEKTINGTYISWVSIDLDGTILRIEPLGDDIAEGFYNKVSQFRINNLSLSKDEIYRFEDRDRRWTYGTKYTENCGVLSINGKEIKNCGLLGIADTGLIVTCYSTQGTVDPSRCDEVVERVAVKLAKHEGENAWRHISEEIKFLSTNPDILSSKNWLVNISIPSTATISSAGDYRGLSMNNLIVTGEGFELVIAGGYFDMGSVGRKDNVGLAIENSTLSTTLISRVELDIVGLDKRWSYGDHYQKGEVCWNYPTNMYCMTSGIGDRWINFYCKAESGEALKICDQIVAKATVVTSET